MEHKVKPRSEEWHKLHKTVALTATGFPEAVGVGKGPPFQFFQSLVDRSETGTGSEIQREAPELGTSMERVIREAYELLTGLRIQDSGFWVPQRDDPLHGLIGTSPDGLVVDGADFTRVLGLAMFRAPHNDLYSSSAGSPGGIPRHYMVQVQGQMAVCGAPWCDFMAVCSKTKSIMLKRVFFQPRYWEHVASRVKQFCFALQESEIMRELGRGLASGTMAKRLQQQPTQDQLLPAEDIITVQNLLRNTGQGTFRGPSRKLLSFDILVGDTYLLPPALSKYSQELLARVDAEVHRKTPSKTLVSMRRRQEEDSTEYVSHRVFYGDAFIVEEEREAESPERVLGEGMDMLEGDVMMVDLVEDENRLGVRDADDEITDACKTDMSEKQSGAALGDEMGKVAKGGEVDKQTQAVSTKPENLASDKALSPTKSQLLCSKSLQGRVATDPVNAGSKGKPANSAPVAVPTTQAVRGRGRGSGKSRGNVISQPRTLTQSGSARQLASDRSAPDVTGAQLGKYPLQGKGQSEQVVPRKIPRISSTLRTGQLASVVPSKAQLAPASAAASPHLSTPAAIAVPRADKEREPASTAASPSLSTSAGSAVAVAGKKSNSASTTAPSSLSIHAAAGVPGANKGREPAESTSAVAVLKVAGRSAKDEWEVSARSRSQRAHPQPSILSLSQVGKTTSSQTPDSKKLDQDSASSPSNHPSPPVSVSASECSQSAGDSADDVGRESQKGLITSDKDGNHWRVEILSSGSDFLPPGLTLLDRTKGKTDQANDVSPSRGSVTQEKVENPSPRTNVSSESKPESVSSQSLKRSAPQDSQLSSKEPKRVPLGRSASSRSLDEVDPASGSGQGNQWSLSTNSPESPTKGQIHRPWLQRADGLEQHLNREQERGTSSFRDRQMERSREGHSRPLEGLHEGHSRPFEALHESHTRRSDNYSRLGEGQSTPFKPRDEGPLSRSWGDRPDTGPHSGGWFPERGGAQVGSQFDRETERAAMRSQFDRNIERDRDQGRVFDYDHHRRIMTEDIHRRTNPAFSQHSSLRQGLMSDPRSRDFDGMQDRLGQPNLSARDVEAMRASIARDMVGGDEGLTMRNLQLQHQLRDRWPPQSARSEFDSFGLRLHPAHTNLSARPPSIDSAVVRGFMSRHSVEQGFPDLESRDPRAEWNRGLPRGDIGRGQAFRSFPPGRRPFEF